jgi:hypothetical protein
MHDSINSLNIPGILDMPMQNGTDIYGYADPWFNEFIEYSWDLEYADADY